MCSDLLHYGEVYLYLCRIFGEKIAMLLLVANNHPIEEIFITAAALFSVQLEDSILICQLAHIISMLLALQPHSSPACCICDRVPQSAGVPEGLAGIYFSRFQRELAVS